MDKTTFFACPAGAKTTFSFAGKRKSGSGLRKRKGWTGGNLGEVRYNQTLDLCCYGIPRVRDFGVSFCFRRPAFERPVVPFAPLPLSGWNTAPCSLISTPPGWGFGRGGRMLPDWVALWMGRSPCGEKRFFFCGKAGCFTFRLFFCLPGWGQNRFFFCKQKRKRFWTPKKKRETGGNLGEVRYNRALVLC